MSGQISPIKSCRTCKASSENSCSRRSFRATSVLVKPQATVNRFFCTTSNQKGPKATYVWQRRLSMGQRKALGRGLNALLGTSDLESDQLRELDIERILPNSDQPRNPFDETGLNERAESIKEHGLVQPVVVRALEDGFF